MLTFILKIGGKSNKNVNCKATLNLATKLTYPSNNHERFLNTFVNTNCWVVLTICLIITIIVKVRCALSTEDLPKMLDHLSYKVPLPKIVSQRSLKVVS